jgi:hypothetical protein
LKDNMKKIFISLFALGSLVATSSAFAQVQGVPDLGYVNNFATRALTLAQQATTFLMVAATIFFIYNVVMYIREKDGTKATERKDQMIRGIIGLFVIVGIWGIIKIISTTLGVTSGNTGINVPCPPGMQYQPNATPPRCI